MVLQFSYLARSLVVLKNWLFTVKILLTVRIRNGVGQNGAYIDISRLLISPNTLYIEGKLNFHLNERSHEDGLAYLGG